MTLWQCWELLLLLLWIWLVWVADRTLWRERAVRSDMSDMSDTDQQFNENLGMAGLGILLTMFTISLVGLALRVCYTRRVERGGAGGAVGEGGGRGERRVSLSSEDSGGFRSFLPLDYSCPNTPVSPSTTDSYYLDNWSVNWRNSELWIRLLNLYSNYFNHKDQSFSVLCMSMYISFIIRHSWLNYNRNKNHNFSKSQKCSKMFESFYFQLCHRRSVEDWLLRTCGLSVSGEDQLPARC